MGAGEGALWQLVRLFFLLGAFHFSHQRGAVREFLLPLMREFFWNLFRYKGEKSGAFDQPLKWLKGLHFLGAITNVTKISPKAVSSLSKEGQLQMRESTDLPGLTIGLCCNKHILS